MTGQPELLADGIPEETTPTPLESRLRRAGALYDDRRLPEAELELDEAIRLAPDDLRAWRLLARVRLRLGRPADARAAFAAIVARAPEDADARLELGLAALKAGDFAVAAAELERAVRVRPDDARLAQYLAYAWARLGRVGEAADELVRAGAPELAAGLRGKPAAAGEPAELALTALAADRLLPSESGIPAGARLDEGVHRLPVEPESETHVAAGALVTVIGDVQLVPATARRAGRVGEALDERAPRFWRCQGQGEAWLGAPRAGAPILTLRLSDDVLFLRESRVLGFSGALGWEAGSLPQEAFPLLHFHGSGLVAVDFAARDVVAVRVSGAQRPRVAEARLLGWIGGVVLQADAGETRDLGHHRADLGPVFAAEGEGVLLIARHGQAGEPIHQRAEPGHDGAGGADSGGSRLHR